MRISVDYLLLYPSDPPLLDSPPAKCKILERDWEKAAAYTSLWPILRKCPRWGVGEEDVAEGTGSCSGSWSAVCKKGWHFSAIAQQKKNIYRLSSIILTISSSRYCYYHKEDKKSASKVAGCQKPASRTRIQTWFINSNVNFLSILIYCFAAKNRWSMHF